VERRDQGDLADGRGGSRPDHRTVLPVRNIVHHDPGDDHGGGHHDRADDHGDGRDDRANDHPLHERREGGWWLRNARTAASRAGRALCAWVSLRPYDAFDHDGAELSDADAATFCRGLCADAGGGTQGEGSTFVLPAGTSLHYY
jgi:hypothetical protein